MIKMLHKREKATEIFLEPNEGERTLLCSNESGTRSPFLGFLDTSADNVNDEMILDYLAKIIADMYLETNYGKTTKKGSDILPGINKRTGRRRK
jgi:hypothetical protein